LISRGLKQELVKVNPCSPGLHHKP